MKDTQNILNIFQNPGHPDSEPEFSGALSITAKPQEAMRKVFISYAREDYKVAKRLYDDLKKAGTDPWMDQENLLVGQNWKEGVRRAIRESDYFLALISSTAVEKKGYYQGELNKALSELGELPPDKIFLLPVRIDECIPKHEILQNLHWADLFPSYESGLKKILKTIEYLQKKKQPDAKIPELSETLKEPDDNVIFDKDRIEAHIVKAGLDNDEDKEIVFEILKRLSKSDRQAITNDLGMKFVFIPPGTFMMGSPKNELGRFKNETLHKVTLTKGLYMQTTQVTQGQWKTLMNDNPSYFKDGGENCPVENVSWDDVQEFITKLNQKQEGTYRLPTEAEWEYACRAGADSAYCFGNDAEQLSQYAWYGKNSGKHTHPVRQLKSNAWGLYDMHGNVWEWCQDWYGDYSSEPVTDPDAPSDSSLRMLRGGSWYNSARHCRPANRSSNSPANRFKLNGFRLVLLPGQQVR